MVLGLAVTAQSPARADAVTTRDAKHDVVRVIRPHWSVTTPVPQVAEGDLTADRVRYSHTRIHAVVHFRQLNHSSPVFGISLQLRYGSPAAFLYADASLVVRGGHWGGHVTQSMDGHHCPIDHRIDYRDDRMSLSFPASCLGSPKWVRVAIYATFKEEPRVFDLDDMPLQHGKIGRYGPRIHHG
jgi:hypothetical protein